MIGGEIDFYCLIVVEYCYVFDYVIGWVVGDVGDFEVMVV